MTHSPSSKPSATTVFVLVEDGNQPGKRPTQENADKSRSPSLAPSPSRSPSFSVSARFASQSSSEVTLCSSPFTPVSSLGSVKTGEFKPASDNPASVEMCSTTSDADGVVSFFLTASDVQQCAHSDVHVTVVFGDSDSFKKLVGEVVAGTWSLIRIHLQFFANGTHPASPCLDMNSPDCSWRNRTLITRLASLPMDGQSRMELISRFVPDEISMHYRFVIEVRY